MIELMGNPIIVVKDLRFLFDGEFVDPGYSLTEGKFVDFRERAGGIIA